MILLSLGNGFRVCTEDVACQVAQHYDLEKAVVKDQGVKGGAVESIRTFSGYPVQGDSLVILQSIKKDK